MASSVHLVCMEEWYGMQIRGLATDLHWVIKTSPALGLLLFCGEPSTISSLVAQKTFPQVATKSPAPARSMFHIPSLNVAKISNWLWTWGAHARQLWRRVFQLTYFAGWGRVGANQSHTIPASTPADPESWPHLAELFTPCRTSFVNIKVYKLTFPTLPIHSLFSSLIISRLLRYVGKFSTSLRSQVRHHNGDICRRPTEDWFSESSTPLYL